MRNCEAYEEWISAFLDGELSGAEQAELRRHMAGCRRCQQYFDDLVAIHEALDQEDEVPVPEGFEERLMARMRETAQERPAKVIRFPQWRRWAALAACCAVAMAGLWSFQPRRTADQSSMEAAVTANTPYMAMDADIPAEDGGDADALLVMMDDAPLAEPEGRARITDGDDHRASEEDTAAEKEAARKETDDLALDAAFRENMPAPSPAAPAGNGGALAFGEEAARDAALAEIPGAKAEHIVKLELDYDDGRAVYEVEIVYNNTEYEIEIDAADGTILEFEAEAVHKR